MAQAGTTGTSSEELVGRIIESAVGALDVFSIYLGEQLGYYRALVDHGPLNARQLAEQSGSNERYAREWLEQQTATGLIELQTPSDDPYQRTFRLPESHIPVLVDPLSELFCAPIGRLLASSMRQSGALIDAYRSGGGVSWSAFGHDMRTAQSDFNRPFFHNSLAEGYLAAVPGLDGALSRPGARVAEIGPGGGWAAIAIARAYPEAVVDAFDIDEPSVALARENVAEAGLGGRVNIHHRNAGDPSLAGQYDLVCAFECVHDMPDPVSVLATMRRLANPGGIVLVMDERTADSFGTVGDLIERFLYGASLVVCLPDGMSHAPSAGTGTVMRPGTFRGYALEAGFADVEVLPLEHDMFRFYRLIS